MSVVRTAVWTVDKNLEVLPDAPLFGGVQGEDNATQVEFHLSGDCPLLEGYQLYIEYVDATGAWDSTDVLEADQDGRVNYVVPLAWTQHGGISTVRLVAKADGQIVYTVVGHLKFDHRDTAKRAERNVVQTLVKDILERLRQLKEDFFARVDPELDATSINPVQNRAVAESVEHLANNVEQNATLIGTLNKKINDLKLIPGPPGPKGDPGDTAGVEITSDGAGRVCIKAGPRFRDIQEMLDTIIAMQEELIVIWFYLPGAPYSAAFGTVGMTWAQWCDSKYNVYGWYYDEDGVYDEPGDLAYEVDPNGGDGVNQMPNDVIREGCTYSTR